MSDYEIVEYLKAANIIKLQSAARMAGLRFKSGDLNKAGIIEKLAAMPSIMRACFATLQRMEGQSSGPNTWQPVGRSDGENPFEDDLRDEKLAQPIPAPPVSVSPVSGVSEAVFQSLAARVSNLEQTRPTMAQVGEKVNQTLQPLGKVISDLSEGLSKRMAEIERIQNESRPIQINIPGKEPIKLEGLTHKRYPDLLLYLEINRRVILTGAAGTGKSMAVYNAAKHFGLEFHLQTPVTMSHEYLGHRDAQGVFHETPTFKAYTQGGLLLWDEADAGLPDAMLAANPIFDGNGFATFGDGNMYPQHPDFMAVFNMNTDGNGATMQYAGRNRLDGATLARFGVRIHWEIDNRIESMMAQGLDDWHRAVIAVREFMTRRSIVDVNATPRHTKTGAALLTRAKGQISRETILTDVLKSGALSDVWNDVKALPAVQAFLRG